MNSEQKTIFIATMAYFLIWNGLHFWEYLPGLFDMAIFLLLLLLMAVLAVVALFQIYKYIAEKQKNQFRLINTGLIVLAVMLTYYKPGGLINFEKLEGENLLHAVREGTASCSIFIRLKEGNRFKKTSICFGTDHYWGTYEIVNDTIKFHYDNISAQNKKGDFAILQLENDPASQRLGMIHYHSEGLPEEGISMTISSIKKEAFKE